MILSKNDVYDDNSNNKVFTIDKIVDEINISEEGKKICQ